MCQYVIDPPISHVKVSSSNFKRTYKKIVSCPCCIHTKKIIIIFSYV